MANQTTVSLAEGVWTKVAENVNSVLIHPASALPKIYLVTQKNTGEPAPASNDTAIRIITGRSTRIESLDLKDYYVKAIGAAGLIVVSENITGLLEFPAYFGAGTIEAGGDTAYSGYWTEYRYVRP